MEQMQGLDAVFAAMESPAAPVHVGSLLIYDPSTAPGEFVRFKDIISFFDNRLQLSKTLRQKMVKVPFGIDYPYWVQDSNFDLEYHVRHVALPKPGDWRQLCILAARIYARPLDLSRPPWEMTVIEGLDNIEGVPKGSYAIVSKVHHVAIDGMSGIELMQATHSLKPTREPLETLDEWKPEGNPSQIGLFSRGLMRASTLPFRQATAMAKSTSGLMRAAKGFVRKDYDLKAILNTPKTRFGGCISSQRVFGAQTFAMKDIQAMRAIRPGAKMNDIMLSITGGAMRHYLAGKNELPETSVTAMAPISVRTDGERSSMGNQVAAMYVPLGSDIKSIEDRLDYVVAETTKAKAMTKALGARQMADMAKVSPNPAMTLGADLYHRLKLADRMPTMVNTIVTNVPGPPVPLYSAGARMVTVYGMLCLVDGVRLGHVVHTYLDDVTLSFTACREAMPDPDFYDSCIRKSYEEHLLALQNFRESAEKIETDSPKATASKGSAKVTTRKVQPKPKPKTKAKTTKSGSGKQNGTAKHDA
jgi:WS/DGAT/MGAT family acyltransferase